MGRESVESKAVRRAIDHFSSTLKEQLTEMVRPSSFSLVFSNYYEYDILSYEYDVCMSEVVLRT